jgi:hypothetical protein
MMMGSTLLIPGMVSAASAHELQDIKGHWANAQIQNWVDLGLAAGYKDGTFKPDNTISRAEFITLVNHAFNLSDKSPAAYSDVHTSDWFADEVAIAHSAGYISGYEDGSMRPNNPVSREEVAVMLAKILHLTQGNDSNLDQFGDSQAISAWSKDFVSSVVAKGYMKGYPDHQYHPGASITRAEAVVALDHARADYLVSQGKLTTYDQPGTYGDTQGTQTINGNVTITTSGVTLQNQVINGDLTLTEGIGDGDVTLSNVTVKGQTIIKGGGIHSIHLQDCALGDVVVNKADGNVRLVASGTTTVGTVTLDSGAKLEESNETGDGFGQVNVSSKVSQNAAVILDGNFQKVQVNAPQIQVQVSNGTVDDLDEAAQGSLEVDTNAKISNLTLNAVTQVKGQGTIEKAQANVSGSTFEKDPGTIGNSTGTSVAGGGGGAPTTQAAVVPVVSNIILNSTSLGSGTNFNVSLGKSDVFKDITADVNTKSKVEIIGLSDQKGDDKLTGFIKTFGLSSATVEAGTQQNINVMKMLGYPDGMMAGFISLGVNGATSGTMKITIRVSNVNDANKYKDYVFDVDVVPTAKPTLS